MQGVHQLTRLLEAQLVLRAAVAAAAAQLLDSIYLLPEASQGCLQRHSWDNQS